MQSGINKKLLRLLTDQSREFDFFQAVRLLENSQLVSKQVSAPPFTLKFRSQPSLRFSAAEIDQILVNDHTGHPSIEVFIHFIHLLGHSGALPTHYTESILQKAKTQRNEILNFLDIFIHRSVDLFYQSWKKYHYLTQLEQSTITKIVDPITQLLGGFPGLLQNPESVSSVKNNLTLFNSGHFSNFSHSASALEQLLRAYSSAPVKVQEFQIGKIYLKSEERTRVTACSANNRLGVDAILGAAAWHCQNKFRIKIGPLSFSQFQRYTKTNGSTFSNLCAITRRFAGFSLDFDIQFILDRQEVPCWQLSQDHSFSLGRSTWLYQSERRQDVEDTMLADCKVVKAKRAHPAILANR